MKTIFILTIYGLGFFGFSNAQVGVNDDNSDPHISAMLDVKSTNKGLLPPRMTLQQRDAISDPAEGLMIYNTTNMSINVFNGSTWGSPSGEFVCGSSQIQDAEGNYYSTVQIGDQCWMAENLNMGTMIHSTTGGTNGDGEQTDNGTLEKYCYDNNSGNCDTYGGHYQWHEMMQYTTTEGAQGICPDGWHIPADAEWCIMNQYVDPTVNCSASGYGGTDAGTKMKSTAGWNSGNGTDDYGYTALPSGSRFPDGSFDGIGEHAGFRSSTQTNSTHSYYFGFASDQTGVTRFSHPKTWGIIVRCVRD